jgi:hypothetical protein
MLATHVFLGFIGVRSSGEKGLISDRRGIQTTSLR